MDLWSAKCMSCCSSGLNCCRCSRSPWPQSPASVLVSARTARLVRLILTCQVFVPWTHNVSANDTWQQVHQCCGHVLFHACALGNTRCIFFRASDMRETKAGMPAIACAAERGGKEIKQALARYESASHGAPELGLFVRFCAAV